MSEADHAHAPFDEAEVRSLNACQRSGRADPLVCPSPMCGAVLVARPGGLECPSPVCEYAQEWAPVWMADESWRHRLT